MNHELAKELKDAGFPLKPASIADGNARLPMFQYGKDSIGRDNTWWLEPSLEELIEACGEHFWNLHIKREGGLYPWIAAGMDPIVGTGSTPTEAVASLWLALNPKKA
jgi:hypothetical protein